MLLEFDIENLRIFSLIIGILIEIDFGILLCTISFFDGENLTKQIDGGFDKEDSQ